MRAALANRGRGRVLSIYTVSKSVAVLGSQAVATCIELVLAHAASVMRAMELCSARERETHRPTRPSEAHEAHGFQYLALRHVWWAERGHRVARSASRRGGDGQCRRRASRQERCGCAVRNQTREQLPPRPDGAARQRYWRVLTYAFAGRQRAAAAAAQRRTPKSKKDPTTE
jgi:hypothetical protein